MATTETFLGLRRPDRTDSTSVITDLDNNYTLIGAAFDPASAVAPQAPKALLRETALTTTYTAAANLINLQPVWNAPSATLRGLFVDVTHTGAGAASRPIEVRRGGNPIWDVDITTQNAVNGLSLQGGAAGTPAVLRAIGVDANVGITLTPKGTGVVLITNGLTVSAGAISLPAGSIPTASLAANAVTQTGIAQGATASPTTVSTSYATLADMSVTLTTTGGDLLVWGQAALFISAAPNSVFLLADLDGTSQSSEAICAMTSQVSIAVVHRFTGVSAGAHTITLRWRVDGGTGTANGTRRELVVTEVKR